MDAVRTIIGHIIKTSRNSIDLTPPYYFCAINEYFLVRNQNVIWERLTFLKNRHATIKRHIFLVN